MRRRYKRKVAYIVITGTITPAIYIIINILAMLMSGCNKESPNPTINTTINTDEQNAAVLFSIKEWAHWAPVLGADSPAFTLYDDRSVIYYQKKDQEYKYVMLSEGEFTELSHILLDPHISKLRKNYDTTHVTCQNTYNFFFRFPNKEQLISVYGHPTEIIEGGELPPKEIREVFSLVSNFKHKDARKWFPVKIEVLFWPYDYAPDESIRWPDDWPGLQDPNTIKRHDSLYSIYLDSKYMDELKSFIERVKPKGAVLISGQKMAISYRFPIPGEDIFRDNEF